MKQILTIKRGDTRKIPVQVFDDSGAPMPPDQIQGLFFTVKKLQSDLDTEALISKSNGAGIELVDADTGMYQVVINPADTDNITGYTRGLHWDIQVVNVLNEVYTLAEGLLAIEADVTRRTV